LKLELKLDEMCEEALRKNEWDEDKALEFVKAGYAKPATDKKAKNKKKSKKCAEVKLTAGKEPSDVKEEEVVRATCNMNGNEEEERSHVEGSRGAVAGGLLGAQAEEGGKASVDREVRELLKQQEGLVIKKEKIQSELAVQFEMVGQEVKIHQSNLTTAEEKFEESVNEKAKVAMEIEALQSEKEKTQRQLEFEQKLMITRWGLEAAIQANDAKNKEIEELKSQVAEKDDWISKDREVILALKKIGRCLRDQKDEAEEKVALLEESMEISVAFDTEREKLKVENKELQKTIASQEKQAMVVLKTAEAKFLKSEDERKKLERKLGQMGASQKAKVAKIEECLQAAEKGLKTKAHEADQLRCQNKTLTTEKTKMQSQLLNVENLLKEVEENLSFEKSKSAAAEMELKRLNGLVNQVESMKKQLIHEQGQSKAAKEELVKSKHREEELSKFVQQMTSAGENVLKSRQESQVDEEGNDRRHDEQGATQSVNTRELLANVNFTSNSTHVRLVEKLLKQIKYPPISTADCSRLVQQLRGKKGKLSGLPMEVIEEEVRKMAMQEAEVQAKECPICFDPMKSKLLHCKQCNQAFHFRCWNEWAQSKELSPEATECPVCRTSSGS